jgi:hypothetical protein
MLRLPSLSLSPALGLAAAGAAVFAAFAVFGGHRDATAVPAPTPTQAVGGFRIELPIYTLASWDPSRIASFSFRLSPATERTSVQAGVTAAFADSCRLTRITRGAATVTCSYRRADAPAVRDAVALNVVASG